MLPEIYCDIFSEKYGYTFQNKLHILSALDKTSDNFRRLEFLGDAVLRFVVTEYFVNMYDGIPDKYNTYGNGNGLINDIRDTITRNKTLSLTFDKIGLIDLVVFKFEEEDTTKKKKTTRKIKSDYVEAILGAVYLDSHDLSLIWQFVVEWIIKTGASEESGDMSGCTERNLRIKKSRKENNKK